MITKLSRTYTQGEKCTYTIEQDSEYPGGVTIRCNGDYVKHIMFSHLLSKIGVDFSIVESEQALKTRRAYHLGKKAFHDRIKAAPCMDKEMMELIKGGEVGKCSSLLNEWLKGWTEENLKEDKQNV
jgi:hypothetical protein